MIDIWKNFDCGGGIELKKDISKAKDSLIERIAKLEGLDEQESRNGHG